MRTREENLFSRFRNIRLRSEAKSILKGLDKTQRILDFGTGDGALALAISKLGFKIEARDMYDPNSWVHDDIRYLQINGENLNNSDFLVDGQVADVVVMRHVLEHSLNPLQTLSTIFAAGVKQVSIAVPNAGSFFARVLNQNWYYWDPPRHLFHFNKYSIHKLAMKSGGKIVEIEYSGIDEVISSLNRKIRTTHRSEKNKQKIVEILLKITHPTALPAGLSSAVSGLISKGVMHVRIESDSSTNT